MAIDVGKIFRACIVGAVVWLLCLFAGPLLVSSGLPFISVIGAFLEQYAVPIGFLAGLVYYGFGGRIGVT